MISKRPEKKSEYLKMFEDYTNGFHINAKSRMKSARGAARYRKVFSKTSDSRIQNTWL